VLEPESSEESRVRDLPLDGQTETRGIAALPRHAPVVEPVIPKIEVVHASPPGTLLVLAVEGEREACGPAFVRGGTHDVTPRVATAPPVFEPDLSDGRLRLAPEPEPALLASAAIHGVTNDPGRQGVVVALLGLELLEVEAEHPLRSRCAQSDGAGIGLVARACEIGVQDGTEEPPHA
jgi:hypothetical protein